ncbi:MAG: hypothetical protein J7M19_02135 [Planctomycetes bacterium]|nr:hypothetical protein [Planctomycetota bacterium]
MVEETKLNPNCRAWAITAMGNRLQRAGFGSNGEFQASRARLEEFVL